MLKKDAFAEHLFWKIQYFYTCEVTRHMYEGKKRREKEEKSRRAEHTNIIKCNDRSDRGSVEV